MVYDKYYDKIIKKWGLAKNIREEKIQPFSGKDNSIGLNKLLKIYH